MDASSEMIHSLLPVFMVSTLGAGALAVGLVEGVAEATALIVKVFSGALSDVWRRRKGLTVFGYGLAALSKPLFALAGSVPTVFAARFMDRIGKGVRGAPRDALIADVTPGPVQGAAYGLRQSLDTVGAFMGPLLAIGLMLLFAGNFRKVFWFAVIPAFVSVGLLVSGVREPSSTQQPSTVPRRFQWKSLKEMGRSYWWVVGVGLTISLARFSDAFLLLRARDVGLPNALTPVVFILMNIVYSLTAYPMGRLGDRMDRRFLLGGGLFLLIIGNLFLARAQEVVGVLVGAAFWGLHLGLTQGLLSAMVAASSPDDLRGTAFGFFNLASGLGLLIASTLAGLLWQNVGPSSVFYTGIALSVSALVLLPSLSGRSH